MLALPVFIHNLTVPPEPSAGRLAARRSEGRALGKTEGKGWHKEGPTGPTAPFSKAR